MPDFTNIKDVIDYGGSPWLASPIMIDGYDFWRLHNEGFYEEIVKIAEMEAELKTLRKMNA